MNSFIETLNQWGGNFLSFAWPMLWQSSLLIVVLFAFDFLLRCKLRATIRYALWLVVLVKLCVPPTLALPTSPVWWLHKTPSPIVAKPDATHYSVTYDNALPLKISQTPPQIFVLPKPVVNFAAWLLVISASISLTLLLWLLVRWWQITRQVRGAQTSGRLTALADEAQKIVGMKFKVQVKLTTNSISPAVCGLFRPAILIPQSLAENFSDEQLRAVLLHELIHLRRRDVWLNFLQALLQIFYWWHPLLWVANARIRCVREEAVDDAVMLALRDEAETYAPTLLEVAKLALNHPLASLSLVGILESRHALRQRIERLVDFSPPRKAGLTLVSLLGILAFTVVAVPMGGAPTETNNSILPVISNNLKQTNSTTSNSFEAKTKVSQLVQDAKLLYEMGKLDEAEAKLKAALALDPENAAAKYYSGLVQAARQTPKVTKTSNSRQAIMQKLKTIRLDRVAFEAMPLGEILRTLSVELKKQDPDRQGINFLLNPNQPEMIPKIEPGTGLSAATNAVPVDDLRSLPITISQTNIALGDALDALVKAAPEPIYYSVEDYAIVFRPGKPAELFYTRVFKVDKTGFITALQKNTGLQTTNVVMLATNFLNTLGVNLTIPGKAIFFNDRLDQLFVRATSQDLDTIERAIEMLNMTAPQIHIKARFVEVPENTFQDLVLPNLFTNRVVKSGTNAWPGLLTDEKFKAVWRALETKRGFITLAEPEATTISGRQVQMRATTIIDVVTNFTFQENGTNGSIVPQTTKVETGPVLDTVSYVLSDRYTINLTVIPSVTEFLGYDRTTNSTAVFNAAGQKVDVPNILPNFHVWQAITTLNLWDGQTVILKTMQTHFYPSEIQNGVHRSAGNKLSVQKREVLVFITVTMVDAADNRIHSDADMPFAKRGVPSQPPPQ